MLRCATFQSGQKAGSQDRYNAPGGSRNRPRAAIGIGAALLLALGAGGCSLTMHLTSFQSDPETTASVAAPVSPLNAALDAEDWRRAQAAFSLAVDPQGSGQVVNWENPATKRKGSFVPAGQLVLVENTICRPFLATIVDGAAARPVETRHVGQACRTGPGEWAMRDIRPEGRDAAPALTTASTAAGKPPLRLGADQPLPAATSSMLPTGRPVTPSAE